MADPLNITPPTDPSQAQYMSPAAIQQMYQYANLLNKDSTQAVPGGKGGWTVGVKNVVDALMGSLQGRWADQYQNNQAQQGNKLFTGGLPSAGTPGGTAGIDPYGNPTGMSGSAPSTKKASQEGALDPYSMGSPDALDKFVVDKMMPATKEQESGGKYDNVTTTKNSKGQAQHALGAYGVMDFHIGPNGDGWDKEILGKTVTPQEFLSNPAIQDAIYKGKMSQYVQKYGVEGAGRAWLGGPGGVNHPERTDPLGTSVDSYGKHTAALVNGGKVPSELALGGGSPGMPSAPPAGLVKLAAAGGAPVGDTAAPIQVAANTKAAAPQFQTVQAPTTPAAQQPLIPQGVLPGQSSYSKEDLANILRNPSVDPALKQQALGMYLGTQVNPRSVPVAGGHILVGPKGEQFYVPDLQKGVKTIGPSGITQPDYQTLSPYGQSPAQAPSPIPAGPPPANITTMPVKPGALPGGGSGVLPQPGPQGALPPPTTVGAATPPVVPPTRLAEANIGAMSDATPVGAVPPMGKVAIPTTAPPVAPPTTTVAGPSMLSPAPLAAGRSFIPSGPPPSGAEPEKNAPPGVLAQRAPPGVSPADWQTFLAFQHQAVEQKGAESAATTPAEHFAKRYDTYASQGAAAQNQLRQLELARNLAADPATAQGLFSGAQLAWKRLTDAMGITEGSAAPTQTFQKVISESILDGLRQFTQGASVGQIRTAEIALARKAAASTENTPQANMALLNMAIKLHQRAADIANQAEDYAVTHGHLDAGFDKQITNWQKDHPFLTNDEILNYNQLFKAPAKEGETTAPAGAAPAASGKPASLEDFLTKAKAAGSTANDAALTDYYNKTYGGK